MQAILTRRVIIDEFFATNPTPLQRLIYHELSPLRWVLRPIRGKPYTFMNYVLGFRAEATEAEWEIIHAHKMLPQSFVTLHSGDPIITFADVLGPEWIPEVNPNQTELLRIEGQFRSACMTWTHFFDSTNS